MGVASNLRGCAVKSLVPSGWSGACSRRCHTWDWERAAKPYRDAIIASLEECYLPDLSRHIIAERLVDPRYFRDDLASYLGSAFSVEPTLTQSAWFRPHNVSEDVPNLYLCGAGTHPGAGAPDMLSSGKIVAEMIGKAESPHSQPLAPHGEGSADRERRAGPRLG